MTPRRIGWIGYGALGSTMAQRLAAAGHEVRVYDVDRRRTAGLREERLQAVASLAEAVATADVVFSTVWNDESLDQVVRGPGGLAASARPGTPLVEMSTVSTTASQAAAQALAAAGLPYLRAPVSGSTAVAARGELAVYASGPRALFEEHLPLLRALSTSQTWLGEGEEARLMKLVINLLLHASSALLGEAVQFGQRAGLPRALVVDAIMASVAASTHYKGKAEALKRGDFSAVAPLTMAVKDVDLALDRARGDDTALPLMAQVRQYLAMLLAQGRGQEDVAALMDAPRLLGVAPVRVHGPGL